MPRFRLLIEYHGGGLAGWQMQPGQATVQGNLQEALYRFCGEEAMLHCAGRTDAGVHARGQVAHVDLTGEYRPFTMQQALNFHLVGTRIAVLNVEEVDAEFHARFSAQSRHYRYVILARRAKAAIDEGLAWQVPTALDTGRMQEAAQLLVGHHNFTSFRDSECQAASPMKTLDYLEVKAVADDKIEILAGAKSFLHHQVRNMVGSLTLVGRGKWSVEEFGQARDSADRKAGGPTAPAEGLTLLRVVY